MANPLISVVIPCFNQGHFIMDALESLAACNQDLIEIIIVNDGSTDEFTNQTLQQLSKKGYNVLFQKNMGLGAARNSGIRLAKGEFILPLDADNKITPEYITKSIEVFRSEDVAVVYGNARYFGDKEGLLIPGPFNLQRLMLGNFIDACAVVRKSVLEEVGHFDVMKVMGYEDWDLWLRIAFKGYKFRYINETLFWYRVTNASMMREVNKNIAKQNQIETYLEEKFKDKLDFELVNNFFINRFKKAPFRVLYRLLLKKFFPKLYQKKISENKMYKGWVVY